MSEGDNEQTQRQETNKTFREEMYNHIIRLSKDVETLIKKAAEKPKKR